MIYICRNKKIENFRRKSHLSNTLNSSIVKITYRLRIKSKLTLNDRN